MKEDLSSHIDKLFENAPDDSKIRELKKELLSNVTARYDDLIAQGRSEEDAYKIAIGGIGDVDELIRNIENDKIYNYAHRESRQRRSAAIVATAIGLYIIAVAVLILFDVLGFNDEIGCVVMFVIVAVATSMLVYNAMTRPKYLKTDDTIVEEFKEWKHANSEEGQIYRSVCSVMWTVIVAVYLFISFFFKSWACSWIIFIIGAALQNIIKLSFEVRHKD